MDRFHDDVPYTIETLSEAPPIFRVLDFLSADECRRLITTAHPLVSPSKVVGNTGFDRTSSSCHLHKSKCKFLVDKIVGLLRDASTARMELPQVARYLVNERYNAHYDSPEPIHQHFHRNGGARSTTVLCYLNDAARGGETEFPKLNLKVQPRRGDAIVFFPTFADGTIDYDTLHAALPMPDQDSIKWVSQTWLRHDDHVEGAPSETEFYEPLKRVAQLNDARGTLR